MHSVLVALVFVAQAAHASLFDRKLMVNGAGATFPYPLYSKWFSEYQKMHPEIAFNYQSIGSGGGVRQLLDETIDFGASDSPMSDSQLKKAKSPIIHIPGTMGAVVISYNFPELKKPLKLNGATIADLFLGKIKTWSDPKILALNPDQKDILKSTPNQDILIIHRSDGSGTTAIFAEYLAKSSTEWKEKVGVGTALRWPTGIGGKGNEGVTSFVKQIPGSIGYVELVFARTLGLPVAAVQNPKGDFVVPSPESVTAAANGALKSIPADFRTSITQVDAKNAYPISAFTYILVYDRMAKGAKREALFRFLKWGLTDGQGMSAKLNYAPLPKALVTRVLKRIEQSEAGVK